MSKKIVVNLTVPSSKEQAHNNMIHNLNRTRFAISFNKENEDFIMIDDVLGLIDNILKVSRFNG